ncbi:hypothetical protein ACHAPG_011529 [Botrytis cinerea]
MTAKEAYEIMQQLQELEFPYNFHNSLSFGLLKTAGIPTISKLLVATGNLSQKNASKRAADTEVLLAEVQYSDPTSERYLQAVARINFLHSRYRSSGKILDEDLLHTLSSGVVETFRFIDKFEWRTLTDVERCAIGVFHKNLGEGMEIPFTPLPSCKEGWRNGLHFANELEEWCYGHEKKVSGRTQSNMVLARRIMGVATASVPSFMRPIMKGVITATMDEHMRISMGLENTSPILASIIHVVRVIRKFIIRHFHLPRPNFMRVKIVADAPNPASGLYNIHKYVVHPWYVKPSFGQRWGLKAWVVKWFGTGIVPGDLGDLYRPQGYDIRTVGPTAQEGKGIGEMEVNVEKLRGQKEMSCPFSFGNMR